MTETELATASINAAVASLRGSGYRVFSGAAAARVAPDWLKKFKPDFLAQRNDEFVVLQVKSRTAAPVSAGPGQLAQLASEIDKHPGWALELLWLGEDDRQASVVDVDDLIARAERVLQVDVEAALLLLWSALETSLQLLAFRVGVRATQPKPLLSELYSLGWVSERHFAEIEEAQELRNTVAHRVGVAQVDPSAVMRLAEIVQRLAQPNYASVDQMVEWFRSQYMDPANGVPYDSREGGYIYVNGGPFDAFDVLSEQFPEALPDEIDDARAEVEHESDAWVRVEDY